MGFYVSFLSFVSDIAAFKTNFSVHIRLRHKSDEWIYEYEFNLRFLESTRKFNRRHVSADRHRKPGVKRPCLDGVDGFAEVKNTLNIQKLFLLSSELRFCRLFWPLIR